jgi:hypothetical protein
MFLPFVGGQLLDKMDQIVVLIGFSGFVCFGHALFALGVSFKSFSLMLFGRFLFGLGGETINVAQAAITSRYFKNKELAFALGLSINAFLTYRFMHSQTRLSCELNFISTNRQNLINAFSSLGWCHHVSVFIFKFPSIVSNHALS